MSADVKGSQTSDNHCVTLPNTVFSSPELSTRIWSNQRVGKKRNRTGQQRESRSVSAQNKDQDPVRCESSCLLTAMCVYSREQGGGQMSHCTTLSCNFAATADNNRADAFSL